MYVYNIYMNEWMNICAEMKMYVKNSLTNLNALLEGTCKTLNVKLNLNNLIEWTLSQTYIT